MNFEILLNFTVRNDDKHPDSERASEINSSPHHEDGEFKLLSFYLKVARSSEIFNHHRMLQKVSKAPGTDMDH